MTKYVKFIFGLLALAIIIECLFLLFINTLRFKNCPEIINYPDKKGVLCSRGDGISPYSGVTIILPFDSVEKSGGETYLRMRYPLIGDIIWLPLTFRVGNMVKYLSMNNELVVPICKLSTGGSCTNYDVRDLNNHLQRGELVSLKVYFYSPASPAGQGSYSCLKQQQGFVEAAVYHKSLPLEFSIFSAKKCAPVVGQIFSF